MTTSSSPGDVQGIASFQTLPFGTIGAGSNSSSRLRRPFSYISMRYTDWNSPVQFLARSGMSLSHLSHVSSHLSATSVGCITKPLSIGEQPLGISAGLGAAGLGAGLAAGFAVGAGGAAIDEPTDRRTSADDKSVFLSISELFSMPQSGVGPKARKA